MIGQQLLDQRAKRAVVICSCLRGRLLEFWVQPKAEMSGFACHWSTPWVD
jgi:hypothetical protein